MSRAFVRTLAEAAAAPYRAAGRFAWHFARGKLAGDPVFAVLLQQGLISDGARILDLGCGQGLLAAWLRAARRLFEAGEWPADWPAPPRIGAYRGIELLPAEAGRAGAALGEGVEVVLGDIRGAEFGPADALVILDVLHFLDPAAHADVLGRCLDSLRPEGVLLLRVGDADGGWRFRYSVAVDRFVARLRGHRLSGFHCRSRRDWEVLLRELGYAVESLSLNRGPPFANVLFIARPAAVVPTSAGPATPAGVPEIRTPDECASR